MKDSSQKVSAEAGRKNASGDFIKRGSKKALRFALTLLILGAFAISAAVANDPPIALDLTPDKFSPQDVGTTVKWTATATDPDGDPISYRFFLKGPSTGGGWQMVQDWSTTNFWDWTPSQEGDYEVNVWMRDGAHADTDGWDAFKVTPFTVNPTPTPNQPPVANSLTPNVASPQSAGSSVQWTASATDPESDTILYKFYLKGPSTGNTWVERRDWSADNIWTWTTTSADAGNSQVNVWIRDGNHEGPGGYDSFKVADFVIEAPNQPPVANSLTPNVASPQTAGSSIAWTASATDPESDTILYKFYLKGPSTGNTWVEKRDWSADNTWTWTTTSADAGNSQVNVWIRDGNHEGPGGYDSFKVADFVIDAPNQPPVANSLTPNVASPQTAGSSIGWTAGATDPESDTILYKFYLKGPSTGNTWVEKRDWSADNTWTWTTTSADAGNSQVNVWIRDGNHEGPGGYDSFKVADFVIDAPNQPPVANSLTPNVASPQTAGSSIGWTAGATDPESDTILYKFYLKGPSTGNTWVEKRDWSADNTWTWTTTSADAGNSQVNVWIRDGNHEGPGGYDSFKVADFVIEAPNQPPVANSLTPNMASPQTGGLSIQWTASATDPESDTILYKFYLKGPSTGNTWVEKRDWSADNTWTWTTTSADAGNSQVNVWIRDGKHAGTDGYDSFKVADFVIAAPNQPPVANSLVPDKSTPQNAGTSIKWTASATDPESDTILYRFYLKGPSTGNAWAQKRDWSADNTWTWTTTVADAGNSQVNVWIRDGKHAGTDGYDSFKVADFTVTAPAPSNQPPIATSLVPDKATPQNAGTSIKWTASATDSESDTLLYRFYLKGPSTGNAWVQKRDWSADNTWTWTTTVADAGNSQVNVWIRDGNHEGPGGYDSFKVADFTVTAPAPSNQPPIATSLVPDKATPQNAGTSIKWTASATDSESDTLLYRFYLKGPSTGNAWVQKRDWSSDNTWTWTTTVADAGNNQVNVWIRDGKHAGTDGYDSFKVADFLVTGPNLPPVANSLTPDKTSPQNAGTTILWTASATDNEGDVIYYRFFLKGPATGNSWAEKRGWSTTPTWSWTTTSADTGNNQVDVWIRDGKHAGTDSWDDYKVADFVVTAPNQPPVFNSLTPNKASPQNVGTSIRWTADATDPDPGDVVYYKFYIKGPSTSGAWQPVQEWSTKNWWDWIPSQQGDYEINVWIRDGKHAGPDSWDAYKITPFTATPVPNQPPVVTALIPNRYSPQIAGTTITWTATASDPDGDQILYRFWMKGPSTGNIWKVMRDWTNSNSWTWSTSPGDVGQYDFAVYVRDVKHQTVGHYDDIAGYKGYQLIAIRPINQPPTVTALSPSRGSPQTAGTTVVWTASASDPERDTLYYKFWLKGPSTGNAWQVVRDWSTSNSWTWSSGAGDAGSYDVYVYVRDGRHESTSRYDSAKGYGGYQLTSPVPPNQPPTVTALSPSRGSPQTAGTSIVWKASASDPERDTLYYKFWLRGPSTGNSWTVVRDWSTSSTWTWSSSLGDAGSYDVYVYVRDGKHESTSRYDSAKGYGGYQLTSPVPPNQPPTVTALSPSRPSPQAAGSTIVWTASATDPDGDPLLYRFWMKGPSTGNAWQVVQDWSASSTWTWSSAPGDAGEYSLYVYVRDGKHESASRYDSAIGYSGYQLVSSGGVYQLTSSAAIQDRPSLVYADDGYLLAYQSWETGSLYSGDIFMKRFDPRWTQLQKVAATGDPAYQDTPSVIFSDGYYYVAYVSDETGNWDIFVKKYDRNLNLIETRRVTTSPADQDCPSLVRAGSDFYLAYQSWETGSSYGGDIFIERFNSAWTSVGRVRVTTETSYQDHPSLVYSTNDDRLYVAYASEESGNRDIFVKKYDKILNLIENKKRITTNPSTQDYPSLVVQNGELDLVYSSQEGGSYDLYLERFGPGWSLIEKVPLTGTSGDELWPSLVYSPFDGLLWVAYVLQDGAGGDIFVQPARSMTGCWAAMDFSATGAYNPYTLTARFYGPTGELADPSSLRLTWNPADAVLTSSTLRKISTGTYQLESRFGSAGLKTFTLSSTVGGCSAESTVTVQVV